MPTGAAQTASGHRRVGNGECTADRSLARRIVIECSTVGHRHVRLDHNFGGGEQNFDSELLMRDADMHGLKADQNSRLITPPL